MTLNLYKSKNYIILLTFIFLSILIIPEYKENGIVCFYEKGTEPNYIDKYSN